MEEVQFCQTTAQELEEYNSKSDEVFLKRRLRMTFIFKEYLTNKNDKTRLDIFVHGFCKAYQKVFFYIRVSYSHTIVFKICNKNSRE